jgi:hypothetical protein
MPGPIGSKRSVEIRPALSAGADAGHLGREALQRGSTAS